MGFDGVGEATESTLDAVVGERLVLLDEHRRVDNIGVKDNGQLAPLMLSHRDSLGERVMGNIIAILSRWRQNGRKAGSREETSGLIQIKVPVT